MSHGKQTPQPRHPRHPRRPVARSLDRGGHDTHLPDSLTAFDPNLLQIPAKTVDEPRYLIVGIIDSKHWSAVITYRASNVRIISIRRSRVEEVALYES